VWHRLRHIHRMEAGAGRGRELTVAAVTCGAGLAFAVWAMTLPAGEQPYL